MDCLILAYEYVPTLGFIILYDKFAIFIRYVHEMANLVPCVDFALILYWFVWYFILFIKMHEFSNFISAFIWMYSPNYLFFLFFQ